MVPKKSTVANKGPPSNNKGNNGGSSSSGVKNTQVVKKIKDADSVSQFLELLAAEVEEKKKGATDQAKLMFDFILMCFRKHYTLSEADEEGKAYKMDIKVLYDSLKHQCKTTVKQEYEELCRCAPRERCLPSLESANTFREFLDVFAAQIQRLKDQVVYTQVLLKCLRSYSSLDETIEELSRYVDQDDANIFYQIYMIQMNMGVKEEYKSLCLDAARKKKSLEDSQDEEVSPLIPELATSHSTSSTVASGERSAQPRSLADANSVREFFDLLAKSYNYLYY